MGARVQQAELCKFACCSGSEYIKLQNVREAEQSIKMLDESAKPQYFRR